MKSPTAEARPVVVTFGRVNFEDSYQWLEEESPQALEWQAQQDRITQEWLESRPSKPLADALMASIPRLGYEFPLFSGGRWFRTRTPNDRKMKLVEIAETIAGPWRCIVDVNSHADGRLLTIDIFVPSPDGKNLLLGFGVNGAEMAELRVFEVDSGKVLLDSIPQAYAHFPAWLPDSSGFYIVARNPADMQARSRIYRHVLGLPPTIDPEDYEFSADTMWVKPTSDGKHSQLVADHLNPRPEYLRDETDGSGWRPFLKGETALFRGDIIGDRYYAVTDDGAPCGRVVSIPLANPKDRSTWKELVPGSANVLATMLVVDGHLVLVDLVDTWSRMRVFDTEGRLKGEIRLPGHGSVSSTQFALFNMADMFGTGAGGDVIFPFSSPAQSPGLYRANIHTLGVSALIEPLLKIDAQIHDYAATSADGARVLYHVIARREVDLSQPQPTAMYGYGGFQVALIPGWSGPYLGAWVQAGGVLVLMHLRGGGELGPQMWHDGRLKHKQNTFNDVYAIAEDVIARGLSTSAQLGLIGGSNGGTMAAVAAVQRPELFRAVISQVPVTDPLARARDPITLSATLDYGDPHDPEMSQVLYAWSPYHNVREGVSYPALLLDSGQRDLRCPAWHGRKQVARLQPANTGAHPILLRVRADMGHGAGDVKGQIEQGTDWLSFFIDQLGLAPRPADPSPIR